ncbi:MAG: hypothetical protein OES24_14625 [Acidimicrobiia bacterium]|nr:hypothetical protein [Acidimicrobiia bacterium]
MSESDADKECNKLTTSSTDDACCEVVATMGKDQTRDVCGHPWMRMPDPDRQE